MADHNSLIHKFISSKTQSPDPTLVSKNEWNQEHVFQGGVNGQALTFDNTQTDHVVWVNKPKSVDISVVDYATGGSGTKADPWTGWEVAFSAISGGRYTAQEFHNYNFAQGWFTTPNLLDMKRYVTVNGTGQGTVIKYTGATIAIRFLGIGTPAQFFDITNCSLNKFVLICTSGTVGISITNVYAVNLNNVTVLGCLPGDTPGTFGSITGCSVAGVFIGASTPSSCFLIRFIHCTMQLCLGTGVLIGNNTTFTSNDITTISFVSCRIQGNQGYGLYTEKYMACLTLESSDIEGNTLGDIWADIVLGVGIVNCYFENTTVPNIAIGSGSGGNGGGVFINGCFFNHHLGGNAISVGASGNEVRGVNVTGNFFLATDASAAAMKLGLIIMGNFCPNYLPTGKIMYDLTTIPATLAGVQLQDITTLDPFVNTFVATANEQTLALKNITNVLNARTSLFFKDSVRVRAKISSIIDNTGNNQGKLAFAVGVTGDVVSDKMLLDNSVAANDTALVLWDVTAATLVRVSRGIADSGGAGFRLLRIPN